MQIESGEQLLEAMKAFQIPCILAAAADLDVFEVLAAAPRTAEQAAAELECDPRATQILLDALAAIGVLDKSSDGYCLRRQCVPLLADASPQSVTAMLRHQANCIRRWARLPWSMREGAAADAGPSIRGAEADEQSFIGAMDVVSRTAAGPLIREIRPGPFRCLLDIGGASGTWTLAWLDAEPAARAILFDLPSVIPLARARISQAGMADRVELAAGDYLADPLPRGADLAWVSAIIHQNSPSQNRTLYRRIAASLEPGGTVLIRDIVMDPSRTSPLAGALFAVNMLAGTQGGNTYTLEEIREDLESAGFAQVQLVRRDPAMNSIVSAKLGD